MPSLYTSLLFAKGLNTKHTLDTLPTQSERDAFYLGSLGFDLFSYRLPWWKSSAASREFAEAMRHRGAVRALISMRENLALLPQGIQADARAFILGIATHFLLSRSIRTYLASMRAQLKEANSELVSCDRELKLYLSKECERWIYDRMLLNTLDRSVEFSEIFKNLISQRDLMTLAGTLTSSVALTIFGLHLSPLSYSRACMQIHLLDVLSKQKSLVAFSGNLEHLCLGSQFINAFTACPDSVHARALANELHHPWVDIYTGQTRTESLEDLVSHAEALWPELQQILLSGSEEKLRNMLMSLSSRNEENHS